MDEKTTYQHDGFTVYFNRPLKDLEGNPFHIESPFGAAQTIGRGNSFDEADIYREALEEIVERTTDARIVAIAETALDATVSPAMRAALHSQGEAK